MKNTLDKKIDIEKKVIGSIFFNGIKNLNIESKYFSGINAIIIESILKLEKENKNIEIDLLANTIANNNDISKYCENGDKDALKSHLLECDSKGAGLNLKANYDLLKETAIKESINSLSDKIKDINIKNSGIDALYKIRKEIDIIEEGNVEQECKSKDYRDMFKEFWNNEDFKYLKTNLIDFDKKFSGIPKSALTILAGLSSMGKSLVAIDLMLRLVKDNNNCLFFSLEQSDSENSIRMLSNLTHIESFKLKGKMQYLTLEEKERVDKVDDEMKGVLEINDNGNINVNDIEYSIKRFINNHKKIDAIFIDHLQIMKDIDEAKTNTYQVVKYANITRDLKNIAKRYNIAIVLLSQLSRNIFTDKDNHIPELHHLRASGDIEQNADMVIFVNREEYFYRRKLMGAKKEDKKKELENMVEEYKNQMDLMVKKNRNGSIGDVKVFVDLERQFINNWGEK